MLFTLSSGIWSTSIQTFKENHGFLEPFWHFLKQLEHFRALRNDKTPMQLFFDSEKMFLLDCGLGWIKCGNGRLDYKVNKWIALHGWPSSRLLPEAWKLENRANHVVIINSRKDTMAAQYFPHLIQREKWRMPLQRGQKGQTAKLWRSWIGYRFLRWPWQHERPLFGHFYSIKHFFLRRKTVVSFIQCQSTYRTTIHTYIHNSGPVRLSPAQRFIVASIK